MFFSDRSFPMEEGSVVHVVGRIGRPADGRQLLHRRRQPGGTYAPAPQRSTSRTGTRLASLAQFARGVGSLIAAAGLSFIGQVPGNHAGIHIKSRPPEAGRPGWPEAHPIRRSDRTPNSGCVARLGVRQLTSRRAEQLRQFLTYISFHGPNVTWCDNIDIRIFVISLSPLASGGPS